MPSIAERVRRLGLIPHDPMRSSPDQQASRLLEAVIGMLTRLAGDGVVVLALEDLHHADPGTRKFVETMLRIGRELPICLIVSFRPDELHRRHPMLALASIIEGDPIIEKINVGPLERHEVMALHRGADRRATDGRADRGRPGGQRRHPAPGRAAGRDRGRFRRQPRGSVR